MGLDMTIATTPGFVKVGPNAHGGIPRSMIVHYFIGSFLVNKIGALHGPNEYESVIETNHVDRSVCQGMSVRMQE